MGYDYYIVTAFKVVTKQKEKHYLEYKREGMYFDFNRLEDDDFDYATDESKQMDEALSLYSQHKRTLYDNGLWFIDKPAVDKCTTFLTKNEIDTDNIVRIRRYYFCMRR